MKGRVFLFLFLLFAYASCGNSSNRTGEFIIPQEDLVPISEDERISLETISYIARNISSPVEIANMFQQLKIPFSPSYLASSIEPYRQNTNFDKALKLGILGADLGYLNMYEKTSSSLDLVSSIRTLAEDINVGQFFDFESIKRLSQNRTNLDSLMFISIDSYTKIDNYLRENQHGQLSAAMIIGVWIEGQYLISQVVSQYPDTLLIDRIGEQKIILNDLLLLISPYCNLSAEFTDLCKDLRELSEKYRNVRITYTQGDPVSVENEGRLEIIQTETSIVEMSEEQLEGIIKITKNIRNKLISND